MSPCIIACETPWHGCVSDSFAGTRGRCRRGSYLGGQRIQETPRPSWRPTGLVRFDVGILEDLQTTQEDTLFVLGWNVSLVLPMSVSRRLRLCGTPPLEWSVAAVQTP
ncbi:hypothetical protein J4Q44_G00079150 [Coregonus suidteri]|uniref:Uncharacterized protein n=1 Tax=Coregonus suidteri TaxID=861788 RepID=A0AAN8M2E5_9TELE